MQVHLTKIFDSNLKQLQFLSSLLDLDCFPSERHPAPECLQRSPKSPISPCKNGYHLRRSAGIFECFLNDTCSKQLYKCFHYEKVQVGKDQEKAQSEKYSHSKNRGGKKPN